GREPLEGWRIVETHGERVHAMMGAGTPFVMTTGHFPSSAIDIVQALLNRPAAFVAGEVSGSSRLPGERRRQLRDRLRDAGRNRLLRDRFSPADLWIRVPDLWGPNAHWNDAAARVSAAKQMLRVLRRPGGVVLVRIDAYWAGASGLDRPFAGMASRRFALGAVRAARLAQCPLVPFVAVYGRRPRTIVVEWGEPVPPPPRSDESAETGVLDCALSQLEAAVGRHSVQYLAQMGWERQWHPETQTWE
ncbi:MAG: hypothetical protein AB7K36_30400, partial [Chloroflexota bacterium]